MVFFILLFNFKRVSVIVLKEYGAEYHGSPLFFLCINLLVFSNHQCPYLLDFESSQHTSHLIDHRERLRARFETLWYDEYDLTDSGYGVHGPGFDGAILLLV